MKTGTRSLTLLFRLGTPQFCAFDLLWLNGRDLRELPLIAHKTSYPGESQLRLTLVAKHWPFVRRPVATGYGLSMGENKGGLKPGQN